MNKKAVVIGSGHAGCEACLALSRLGIDTTLLTLNLDSIAYLACNPSIGGTAKGHLVCEIDALGGEMGVNTDKSLIQIRMLNLGKGPAVHSLRAQADKIKYHSNMKQVLEKQKNLTIVQAEASEIITDETNSKVVAVKTAQGQTFPCDAVVICTGVYLKSRIIIGDYIKETGPNGFTNATVLTDSLRKLGFEIRRFKTGTPCRVHSDSINYSLMEEQKGDTDIQPFSFLTKKTPKNRASCYLTYTTQATKDLIKANLDRCPTYNGVISGVGPRYCPSIETKIVRFSDKDKHQIFIEPEALDTKEMYVQGMSTSMPVDIQQKLYETVVGLENVHIMRNSYAIEYDCIDSTQLYPTLAFKLVKGVYTAGQINGTSGYEEAGAQGILAGINAALYLKDEEQLVLHRDESYIGVLVDDLVTKGTNEPYRMMTSRAEYRMHLRQDNADLRLTPYAIKIGLATKKRIKIFNEKLKQIEQAKNELNKTFGASKIEKLFADKNENLPKSGISLKGIIKRSNIDAKDCQKYLGVFDGISLRVLEYLTTEIKYEGYIQKEQEQIIAEKKEENIALNKDYDYMKISGLRMEARQKLCKFKPLSVGQASRISGVNPADIAVLLCAIKSGMLK
jgi:tRNA uridine 5-carboxymethylaminomethyl modification enzyme